MVVPLLNIQICSDIGRNNKIIEVSLLFVCFFWWLFLWLLLLFVFFFPVIFFHENLLFHLRQLKHKYPWHFVLQSSLQPLQFPIKTQRKSSGNHQLNCSTYRWFSPHFYISTWNCDSQCRILKYAIICNNIITSWHSFQMWGPFSCENENKT